MASPYWTQNSQSMWDSSGALDAGQHNHFSCNDCNTCGDATGWREWQQELTGDNQMNLAQDDASMFRVLVNGQDQYPCGCGGTQRESTTCACECAGAIDSIPWRMRPRRIARKMVTSPRETIAPAEARLENAGLPVPTQQVLRLAKAAKERYPCNQCIQAYSRYGGYLYNIAPPRFAEQDHTDLNFGGCSIGRYVGAGMTQADIAETENRLNRTEKIFTRCRSVSPYDILM